MKFSDFHEYLSLALKIILAITIINSVYLQLWYLASINTFLLVLLLLPRIVKSYKINIPIEFEILLLAFVIFSLIFGRIGGVLTPIFFGIATSFIGFIIMLILYSTNQIKKNYFLILLFAFNFAVAFGFGLEFIKYYLKILLGHEITIGHYEFSMKNMTYVIFGALISVISGFAYMKSKKGILGRLARRFLRKNPELFSKANSPDEILEQIKKGENEKTEFKSTLRINLHTEDIDKKMEHSALKTLTAFLNSKGGTLLLGVSNNGEITGIEKDRFENNDKFSLHLTNLIKEKIGKKYLHLINLELIEIDGKTVAEIKCQKSDAPVFFKLTKDEEEFYIRAGPSSAQIRASELVDYIEKRFRKKD